MNQWDIIIDEWLEKKPSYRKNREDLILLLKLALENTMLPEKSWFGFPPSKNSIGIFFGRIMLVGFFGNTIEIIVDQDISKEIGLNTRIVGTSKPSGLNLYWISTDFENIKQIISNDKIWKHYKIASLKVDSCVSIRSERKDWLKGKYLVKDIFNGLVQNFEQTDLEKIFQKEIELSKEDNNIKRKERLKNASKKPISTFALTKIFIRNADVVVEVLNRANEFCEFCGKKAPFIKDNDGKGYLEVHHIIPLSENGDDTVENAIGLCPNCHRKAHYGKKEFDINKKQFNNNLLELK